MGINKICSIICLHYISYFGFKSMCWSFIFETHIWSFLSLGAGSIWCLTPNWFLFWNNLSTSPLKSSKRTSNTLCNTQSFGVFSRVILGILGEYTRMTRFRGECLSSYCSALYSPSVLHGNNMRRGQPGHVWCPRQYFKKTWLKPEDIGILVVSCSLFNRTPSLSTMILNRYKLRQNIQSFNLGGMGFSAKVISIYLSKDLLHVHKPIDLVKMQFIMPVVLFSRLYSLYI